MTSRRAVFAFPMSQLRAGENIKGSKYWLPVSRHSIASPHQTHKICCRAHTSISHSFARRKCYEWLCSNRVAVSANGLHGFTPAPCVHLLHDPVNVVPDRILREIQLIMKQ